MAEPLVATYSIVGSDLGAGEWGVAIPVDPGEP